MSTATNLLPVLAAGHEPAIPDRYTGELVPLTDATAAQIAACRDHIRAVESELREAKALMDREVVARMDRDHLWTIHEGPWKLTAPSPAPKDSYDAQAMRTDLLTLVDEGSLSVEAVDRAVPVRCDVVSVVAGINALRKGGGPVAEVVERHVIVTEPTRRVSVKRGGSSPASTSKHKEPDHAEPVFGGRRASA